MLPHPKPRSFNRRKIGICMLFAATATGPFPTAQADADRRAVCAAWLTSADGLRAFGRKIREKYYEKLAGGKWESFSWPIYDDSLERFRNSPSARPASSLFEEELAYFKATLERLGNPSPRFKSLNKNLENTDWATRYRLTRLLEGTAFNPLVFFRDLLRGKYRVEKDFSFGLTALEAETLVIDIYAWERHSIFKEFSNLRRGAIGRAAEQKLKTYARKRLDQIGLKAYLRDAGVLRDPGRLDAVTRAMRSEKAQIAFGILTNLGIQHGIVGRIPSVDLIRIPPEALEKYFEMGIEKAWPKIVASYGNRAKRQLVFDSTRSAIAVIGSVVTGWMIYQSVQESLSEIRLDANRQADALAQALLEDARRRQSENDLTRGFSADEFALWSWLTSHMDEHSGRFPGRSDVETMTRVFLSDSARRSDSFARFSRSLRQRTGDARFEEIEPALRDAFK